MMKAFNENIVDEFRANGGKVGGQFEGANLLLLTTTGAKSGQPRLAPLAYFTIDGKMIIIGSKAGADTNPDWVHNLRANPRAHIEVGTDAYDVSSRELPRRRARRDLRQGRRRGTGVRRVPVEDQPGHPAVRTRAGLAAAVETPQCVGDPGADRLAGDHHVDHRQRLVGVATRADKLGGDAGRVERRRIGFPLVT